MNVDKYHTVADNDLKPSNNSQIDLSKSSNDLNYTSHNSIVNQTKAEESRN